MHMYMYVYIYIYITYVKTYYIYIYTHIILALKVTPFKAKAYTSYVSTIVGTVSDNCKSDSE